MNTKSLIAKSAEGFPLLGYCVYWSISEVEIPYQDFCKLLTEVGLDTDLAKPIQAKSALIKAVKSETGTRHDSFHRHLVDDKDRAAFAIVAQQVDAATTSATFSTETKVVFDKTTKDVVFEGYNTGALKDSYDKFRGTYTGDHLRKVTLETVKSECQGLAIRERGGVYFVPATHIQTFEKLQALISKFPGCSIDVIPVIDTAQARSSTWKSLTGEVQGEIVKMKEDLSNLEDGASDRSVNIRVSRYQELKSKIENYEILLQGTAEGLKTELDGLTLLLRKKLI